MADITLAHPQAGQHVVLQSVPDSRLVLQFPTDQATMERSGDNLTFTFDDGASIEISDFYTQYSQESMPEFVVDGTLLAGADFFNAFGPDLMPAAGPGAATRAARYNEFGSSDLHDGITHLNGLDYSLAFGAQLTENVNTLGSVPGMDGGIGGQGEKPGADGDPEVPAPPRTPAPPHMGSAEALLDESDFTSGGHTTNGDIDVTLEGAGTVSVGEMVFDVPAGPFSQQGSISTENGVLDVTLSRDAEGNLTLHYEYAAHQDGVAHDKNTGHDELVEDNFNLSVSDGVSSAEGSLDVGIKDGTPTLTVNGGKHAESSVVSGGTMDATAEGSFAFDFGPDNRDGKSFAVNGQEFNIPTEGNPTVVQGLYGTLTVYADGSYGYQANPHIKGNAQDSFAFRITDADGDQAEAKIDVNVTPPQGPDGSTIAHASVNEAGLSDGSEGADRSEISDALHVPGYAIVGVAGQGRHGTVSRDAEGNWHYALNEAIDSGEAQGANTVTNGDSVKLIVQDGDGNIFEVDVPVDIVDDVPTLDLNGASAVQDADGDHFRASFDFDFGADTLHNGQSASVSVSVDGETVENGVTVNPDGSVSYEQSTETAHTEFGTQGQAHDITVTVTDADGDSVSQSVHLETVGVQVGNENSNTVTGGGGSDIIIGDQGETPPAQENVTYNISLVLDTSASMSDRLDNGQTRMQASVEALKNLVDNIAGQTGEGLTVNIQLVGFSNLAQGDAWLSLNQDNVSELKGYLDSLARNMGGQTNYADAFQKVIDWFSHQEPASDSVHNLVYFVSDGNPNMLTHNGEAISFSSVADPDAAEALGYGGLVPRGYDAASNMWSGFPTKEQLSQFSHDYPELVAAAGGSEFKAFMSEAARQWTEFVSGRSEEIYQKLVENGIDVHAAGFDGGGLDADILNRFDNSNGADILHNADELNALLNPGAVLPGVFAGQDILHGGAGNDVIFGDHVSFITAHGQTLDGMDALRAAVEAHAAANGFLLDGNSDAAVHQYVLDHPEVAQSLQDPSSSGDQSDLIVGGSGNDVLVGQGGDDLLLGDGDDSQAHHGSADALNALLGQHAHGSNLTAGVQHLMEHGSLQEIRDFVDGIESSGVENAQDGNDYLLGGTGDDVLFGQGGDDRLFGGDGSDALLGGSGNDYLDGGNDAAVDHLYGGSGNDIFMYHPNDVIDGGSGMDVLLVGNTEDMDQLFSDGRMDGNVGNVEMIVSGDVNDLTSMNALKDIGITLGDNRIDFGQGWHGADSAHDGFNAWTNGSVTVEVGADVQVSAQDSLQQQAEVAAQKICSENG